MSSHAPGAVRTLRAWLRRPRIATTGAILVGLVGVVELALGHPWRGGFFTLWAAYQVWEVRRGTPGVWQWWPGGPEGITIPGLTPWAVPRGSAAGVGPARTVSPLVDERHLMLSTRRLWWAALVLASLTTGCTKESDMTPSETPPVSSTPTLFAPA